LLANAGDARDLLDIDDEVRLGPAGAKLPDSTFALPGASAKTRTASSTVDGAI
jgi:hypothetical protein